MTFTIIDEFAKQDHSFLNIDDSVYYMKEYYPGVGFSGEGNSLILNLKKSMEARDSDQWHHKRKAILHVATLIAKEMDNSDETKEGKVYWIPVPPSKIKSDPLFDNRIYHILRCAVDMTTSKRHFVADVFSQDVNRESFSSSTNKRSITDLVSSYSMSVIPNYNPDQDVIIIFDDVLTTGCHYKAIENVILRKYNKADIRGVFVARRVPS